MNNIYTQINKRACALASTTASDLSDLVRTPSFSTKEKAVAELIEKKMLAAGFDEVRLDGLGNVIGRIGSGKRTIAFDAHIDTVYPGEVDNWDFDPFSGKVEGGWVYGRGTVDQKGGMASMLSAGRIIRELDLTGDLTVLFTGTVMEEDCDGLCWNYLIREENIRPDLVVITEPTNLNLYRGQRGRMEMSLKIRGTSCHGSAPERGDNAIYKMSRIALAIEQLNSSLPTDSFLGKGTVTVSEFKSSSPSQCAVADYAEIYLDRRLTALETRESAVGEVLAASAELGYRDIEIEIPTYRERSHTGLCYPMEKYYPTWTLEPGSPWLAIAEEVFRELFAKNAFVDKWTFSTNGVTIAGVHGIPCLGMGPGNEVLAHAPNERCKIEDLTRASAFYAALVAHLGGRIE